MADPTTPSIAPKNDAELASEKLSLEVANLQLTNKNLSDFRKKNIFDSISKIIGYISAVFLLITGITGPLNSYLHQQYDEKKLRLADEMKQVLDMNKDSGLKRSSIIQLSIDPPRLVAPLILKTYNDGYIAHAVLTEIFTNMFELSKSDLNYETFLDKLTSFMFKSNREILETELLSYATRQFNDYIVNKDKGNAGRTGTYIALINSLGLNKQKAFDKAYDILRKDCKTNKDLTICSAINEN